MHRKHTFPSSAFRGVNTKYENISKGGRIQQKITIRGWGKSTLPLCMIVIEGRSNRNRCFCHLAYEVKVCNLKFRYSTMLEQIKLPLKLC